MKNFSLSNNERLSLISGLSTMLKAGIPILEVIDSLLEQAQGNQKKILEAMRLDLNQGHPISYTLMRFPKAFDPVFVNLLKAAGEAGTLDTTLRDLTGTIRKSIEFNEKVKAVFTYPGVVLVVFIGVILLVLTFVVPRIEYVFISLRVTLPLPTQVLIWLSHFFLKYALFIFAGFVFLGFVLFAVYRNNKRVVVNALLSLPLLSRIGKQIDLARFTRSMSLLLSSGIPITEALALSKNVVDKQEIYTVIATCEKIVLQGKNLSEGFRNNPKVIPVVVTRLTEAGEKSGTLENSMQELAEYFDLEVTNSLKLLTTLLEPLLIVMIGLVVGSLMLTVVTPIYQLIGNVKPRG